MKPSLKIYRGYANEREIVVTGHVFKKHPPGDFSVNKRWYKQAWMVIRRFRIKTLANVEVVFVFNGLEVKTKTLDDGFFRFAIPYSNKLQSGWNSFFVKANVNQLTIEKKGEFVKPFPGEYGVISDIDDTFLISHSGNIFKKLYVMLTKNVEKRHVFEEVVEHYRFLNQLGRKDKDTNNAFFYVSSSEWNLYDFIIQFTKIHDFPKAVLKLKSIKTSIADFLFTGGGSHNHKYFKIKHLVEFYPELRFILLGDDSQKDPFIYEAICKIFPQNISAVYIRQTARRKKSSVIKVMKNLQSLNVKTCYFENSNEAFEHTKENLG